MKTTFIQATKYLLLVNILFFVNAKIEAQDLGKVLFGKDNKSTYMGQYNYNGKRKNGFGIERYNNGSLYIGDFLENNITGRGMLYSPKKGIPNVSGAVVYVGNLMNGKKQGTGTCYNANGDIIFCGKFINDKPAEGKKSDKRFAVTQNGKKLYMGEMFNNSPEGFGLTMQEDGTIVLGTTKNGMNEGIGMKLYSPDTWEVGRWKAGSFSPISNSKKFKENLASFRTANREANKVVLNGFAQALNEFAQALNDLSQISENSSEKDTPQKNSRDIEHNNKSKMLNINVLIAKQCDDMQKMENLVGKNDSKNFSRDCQDCIDWLRAKQRNGENFISKEEWDNYTELRNKKADARHQKRMATMRATNDRLKEMAKNQSLRNYSNFANTLRLYNDNPEGRGYNYDNDIYFVRKLQRKMKEIRSETGCQKSKWEDWNGIPGSM